MYVFFYKFLSLHCFLPCYLFHDHYTGMILLYDGGPLFNTKQNQSVQKRQQEYGLKLGSKQKQVNQKWWWLQQTRQHLPCRIIIQKKRDRRKDSRGNHHKKDCLLVYVHTGKKEQVVVRFLLRGFFCKVRKKQGLIFRAR